MSTKDPGRPGSGRIRDIEDVIPTSVPGERMAPSERVDTEAVPRVYSRKKTPWLAWVLSFLVLGGVAFGVTFFLTRPLPTASSEATDASDAVAEGEVTQGAVAVGDTSGEVGADTAQADNIADAADAGEGTADGGADAVAASDGEVAEGPDGTPEDVTAGQDAADAGPAVDATENAKDTALGGTDAQAPAAEVVVQRDPARARRLNAEGFAARKGGDHEKARALYAEALNYNPDDPTARYNLACELALAGEQKEALAALTYLYKLGTPEARKLLAAARDDKDFESLKDLGQFVRLTR
jgi:hypothetical protein